MEIRPLTPDDKAAQDALMAEAFNSGKRPDPPTEETPPKKEGEVPPAPSLGVFDGSRLVANLTMEDLHLFWGTEIVPLCGITSVACAADQRGRGHVGRLLTESLRAMQSAGQYLGGLFPFSYAFYRRYGWDWVGERRTYTVPTAEIKAYPEGKHLRCYDGPEALEVVRPLYEAFAHRYRGMTTRTDASPPFWDQALKHRSKRTTYVHVYQNRETGEAEGYLTFRHPTDDNRGRVGDFFANTPAAYRGLLSVLHYYGTQVRRVRFSGPADCPLPLYVMHDDLETKVTPLFMGRIVDVTAALSARRVEPMLSGQVLLQVSDEQADWNQKTFKVTAKGGKVMVCTVAGNPGVALDIQTLSQGYWGQPSLDSLRSSGRISVTDEAQYALLSRLLPPGICYLQDDF